MADDALGRTLRLYRSTAASRSALLLIAVNAIPVVGVFFFGWSLITILVLYWLENGIVGFWNLPKILLAQGSAGATSGSNSGATSVAVSAQARGGRVALATFFLVHYGMFWLVHGLFVFLLPAFAGGDDPQLVPGCSAADPFGAVQGCSGPFGALDWSSIAIAGIALFISHGASFLFNYIGRAEYLTASPNGQMFAVYGRVVILHLTIIFGAFLVAGLGAPIAALLVLIVLKTAFDLGLHLRERRAADRRLPADTAFGQLVGRS